MSDRNWSISSVWAPLLGHVRPSGCFCGFFRRYSAAAYQIGRDNPHVLWKRCKTVSLPRLSKLALGVGCGAQIAWACDLAALSNLQGVPVLCDIVPPRRESTCESSGAVGCLSLKRKVKEKALGCRLVIMGWRCLRAYSHHISPFLSTFCGKPPWGQRHPLHRAGVWANLSRNFHCHRCSGRLPNKPCRKYKTENRLALVVCPVSFSLRRSIMRLVSYMSYMYRLAPSTQYSLPLLFVFLLLLLLLFLLLVHWGLAIWRSRLHHMVGWQQHHLQHHGIARKHKPLNRWGLSKPLHKHFRLQSSSAPSRPSLLFLSPAPHQRCLARPKHLDQLHLCCCLLDLEVHLTTPSIA